MTVMQKIDRLVAKAQMRGDDICGDIMDLCGVCRCPKHYVIIAKLLDKYRRRIVKAARKV